MMACAAIAAMVASVLASIVFAMMLRPKPHRGRPLEVEDPPREIAAADLRKSAVRLRDARRREASVAFAIDGAASGRIAVPSAPGMVVTSEAWEGDEPP